MVAGVGVGSCGDDVDGLAVGVDGLVSHEVKVCADVVFEEGI